MQDLKSNCNKKQRETVGEELLKQDPGKQANTCHISLQSSQ